jgi:DNA-binding phage protein
MSKKFKSFTQDLESGARQEGPEAVAELASFNAHFSLAAEFLALRTEQGLTQRQLSAKSGIPQADISRIESARGNPTLVTVSSLARALGATLHLVPSRRRPRATRPTRPARRG